MTETDFNYVTALEKIADGRPDELLAVARRIEGSRDLFAVGKALLQKGKGPFGNVHVSFSVPGRDEAKFDIPADVVRDHLIERLCRAMRPCDAEELKRLHAMEGNR